jgi:hypothetical protein
VSEAIYYMGLTLFLLFFNKFIVTTELVSSITIIIIRSIQTSSCGFQLIDSVEKDPRLARMLLLFSLCLIIYYALSSQSHHIVLIILYTIFVSMK